MLILWLPVTCWGLLAVAIFVIGAAMSNRIGIFQFCACMLAIWLFGLGFIAWDPSNDFPDETPIANETPSIGPGYGWSCVPANNSTVPGEIVCRPVTIAGGP